MRSVNSNVRTGAYRIFLVDLSSPSTQLAFTLQLLCVQQEAVHQSVLSLSLSLMYVSFDQMAFMQLQLYRSVYTAMLTYSRWSKESAVFFF